MTSKALSAQEILANIESFISNEDNKSALRHIENHVLPIVEQLQIASSPKIFHTLLYSIGNVYFLNQKYEDAQRFVDMLQGTEFSEFSIELAVLHAQILINRGEYVRARDFLESIKCRQWDKNQRYIINYYLGLTNFWKGEYTLAFQAVRKSYDYFRHIGNWHMLGCASNILGYISFQRCFFDVAESYLTKALEYYRRDARNYQIGTSNLMIGILYYRTGRYQGAKKHISQAYKCFKACNNQNAIINSLLALARTLVYTTHYHKSINILDRTKAKSIELGYTRGNVLSCEILADAYCGLGQYKKALRVLKEDAQIAAQIAPEGDLAVEAYRRLSDVYLALGNTAAADRAANKTLALAEKLEDRYELGSILRVFGLLAAQKKDHNLARSYFNESIITLKMIKESFELARTYRTAAEYCERLYFKDDIDLEYRQELLEEARSHAVEAMHLYSIQELGGPAEECKELVNRIESKLSSSADAVIQSQISFDAKWLHHDYVVGCSNNSLAAIARAGELAIGDIPVLVMGETGTGKELIARLLHRLSLRAKGPFVPVNCASIPETIFESELFGHKRGAFTGAHRDRQGLMEAASGGTLFLDEISELSSQQQAKLLRALQEGMIRRVGETAERPIDIRVISASNEDVEALVAIGKIRKDFYYRICVETISLDPLRRRKDDISALFAYYMDGDGASFEVEDGVFELLDSYHWPGNVRELVGVARILKLLAQETGVIRICDLPLKIRDAAATEHGTASIDRNKMIVPTNLIKSQDADESVVEKLIRSSLKKHGGNKAAVARDLGISRTTLYRRLQELDIQ
jgi:DNA-binding NtrC family response regulator